MLRVILFGSTSEIGEAIIDEISKEEGVSVQYVGRRDPRIGRTARYSGVEEFKEWDFLELTDIDKRIDEVWTAPTDIAILAFAVLPEEEAELDTNSVKATLYLNTVSSCAILSAVASKFLNQGFGKIVILSSVAAVAPRKSNFTYGASKAGFDFFARGLQLELKKKGVELLIVRPGYVFTEFSSRFRPAPFAISREVLGQDVVKALSRGKLLVYTPRILAPVMRILSLLSGSVVNYVEEKSKRLR